MASLKDKANNILTDKNTNILPENIKDGVTVMGVTGTMVGPSYNLLETSYRIPEVTSNFGAEWLDCQVVLAKRSLSNNYNDKVLLVFYAVVNYGNSSIGSTVGYSKISKWNLSFKNENNIELFSYNLSSTSDIFRNASSFSADTYQEFALNAGSYNAWKKANIADDMSKIKKLVITDTSI